MNVWRYQTRERLEIDAPVEHVYGVASDPKSVPSYAPEVARIEVLKRLGEGRVLVRSHLKIARMTFGFLYLYHYRAPTHYSGVQEKGALLRGFFTLTFSPRGDRTIVSHTEGLLSRVPFFAWVAGFIYFRVVARGGMGMELDRLKALVESRTSSSA
jgi:hypothetical protein